MITEKVEQTTQQKVSEFHSKFEQWVEGDVEAGKCFAFLPENVFSMWSGQSSELVGEMSRKGLSVLETPQPYGRVSVVILTSTETGILHSSELRGAALKKWYEEMYVATQLTHTGQPMGKVYAEQVWGKTKDVLRLDPRYPEQRPPGVFDVESDESGFTWEFLAGMRHHIKRSWESKTPEDDARVAEIAVGGLDEQEAYLRMLWNIVGQVSTSIQRELVNDGKHIDHVRSAMGIGDT